MTDATATATSIKREEAPHSEGLDGNTNDNSNENENSDEVLPKSPFVTTSDVLNQLNKQLSDLSPSNDGTTGSTIQQPPRFELQKRLPDGSAIPATQDDAAAADFKTKLEQSAKFVSQLEKSEDRQYWAEQQRLTGNAFFQRGDYKGAMDIYLTCLVVKEHTPDFVRDTFLPILNNLAQCTLQLGMHMKTILFCEMALEEVSKAKEIAKAKANENDQQEKKPEDDDDDERMASAQRNLADAIALCKIFFKQAKALRLTGHYGEARKALNSSLDCLIGKENNDLSAASSSTTGDDTADAHISLQLVPYQKAIKKEYRYLDIAEKEARKNLARQKRAMQTVLSSTSKSTSHAAASSPQSLYENSSEPRQYSKLRARKTGSSSKDDSNTASSGDCDSQHPSYSQYYWSMVARVAKSLLAMLGDDKDTDAERVPKANDEKMKRGKKSL